MGDPSGIGPEIIMKSLKSMQRNFIPLLLGKIDVFRFYNDLGGLGLDFYSVLSLDELLDGQALPVLEVLDDQNLRFRQGITTTEGAKTAMESIRLGAQLAKDKKIDALVTAPICKKSINEAGYNFKGHTDFLADITGVDKFVMMLIGGNLKVSLVTIHVPFRKVLEELSIESVLSTIRITDEGLKKFGISNPRIAVCGLNPHAGEEGLLGDEEQKIIQPAVDKALVEKINVTGVFPADTVFWDANHGKADAVVALYHDQGLIPVKLLAFDKGVNVTLGLPIIRTSPDHGTAFGIAGKNIADCGSMLEAIVTAVKLAGYK